MLTPVDRFAFVFHNPNHAAALICALMPLCWGWRRCAWIGRILNVGLFAILLLTQSRTGVIVAAIGIGAYLLMRPRDGRQASKLWIGLLVATTVSLLWMWPRLALDGSVLNRPKIWLAGIQLFAANPNGVGLGNSGTLASVFMLDEIPPIRTMINSHITMLAEFGWIVGVVWFAFVLLAALGVRKSPRIGIAYFGLVLSVLFGGRNCDGKNEVSGKLGWPSWADMNGIFLVASTFKDDAYWRSHSP